MNYRRRFVAWILPLALLFSANGYVARGASGTDAAQVETIVCIRHGEKPKNGIGNLDTQGLNRALELPRVLLKMFGKPDYIFAPDPKEDMLPEGPVGSDGKKEMVCYVRPLLTIGPTAIECGLPINTVYGLAHIDGLEKELDGAKYRGALVFVAWEHLKLDDFVKNEMRDHGGNPNEVPEWSHGDYDSIFVLKIMRTGGGTTVKFEHEQEGLNGLSSEAPRGAGN